MERVITRSPESLGRIERRGQPGTRAGGGGESCGGSCGKDGPRREPDHDIPRRQPAGAGVRGSLLGVPESVVTVAGTVTEAAEHRQAGVTRIESENEELGLGQRIVGHGEVSFARRSAGEGSGDIPRRMTGAAVPGGPGSWV